MEKANLREQGYYVQETFLKKRIVNILWVSIAVFIIFGTYIAITLNVGYINNDRGSESIFTGNNSNNIPVYVVTTIGIFVLYYALKLVLTIAVCTDKLKSIKLKMLEGTAMPICFCKEALKIWQLVLTYLLPVIFAYGVMITVTVLQISEQMEYGFMTMLFFSSFIFSFDLALVIYALYIKFKTKADYISVEYHIYGITLYKRTFMKFAQKNANLAINIRKTKTYLPAAKMCGNPKCENYGMETEENPAVCPVCQKRTYEADIFTKITVCGNPKCEEYMEELKENYELCKMCGEKTQQITDKANPALTAPSIVMALATFAAVCIVNWVILYNDIHFGLLWFILSVSQFLFWGASVITGIISKSKETVFIAVCSLPLAFAVFYAFMTIWL